VYFIKFVLCASVLGLLITIFYHCVIAAMQAGACVERAQRSLVIDVGGVESPTKRKRALFALFSVACGLVLCALALYNLVARDPWNASYGQWGISTFWLGVLLCAAGVCTAGQTRALTTGVYALSAVIVVSCIDNASLVGSALGQTIKATKSGDDASLSIDRTGRIVLLSIQTGAILVALITSVITLIRIKGDIGRLTPLLTAHRDTPLMLLALLHLFYFGITTAAESAFEYVKRERPDMFPTSWQRFALNMDGRVAITTMVAQLMAGRKVSRAYCCSCILV
jgi:hypothetical protein